MGGCVSLQVSCDQVLNHLGSCFCSKLKYIQNLKKNLKSLEIAMEDLKAVRADLLRKVQTSEERGLQRLHQIKVWLKRVETIESQFNELNSSTTIELQRLCFYGSFSKNLSLSYSYGKRVFLMLNIVEDLTSKGYFQEVAHPPTMEVQCLGTNDAWDLFKKKVGQNTLESHPDIPKIARKVVGACRGLPLALNVIGETMACKKTTQEWDHAVYVLKTYAADFSDVKEKILPILKYSYDNLENDNTKSCFQYCSLFSEDTLIEKERLIDYWICEGLVVLDLSWNVNLNALPEQISELVSLRYLDLSESNIGRLPIGLLKLKKLMHLNLESMLCLESVSGISHLSSLKTLRLLNFRMWLTTSLLEELKRLEDLEVLTIEITSSSPLKQLLCCHKLVRCIQKVSIKYIDEESIEILILPTISNLGEVFIGGCGMREILIERNTSLTSPCFSKLSKVLISGCNELKDLTWLLFAPNLTHLNVWNSSQVEEIISKERASSDDIVPFRKLEYIHLWDLPELKSIYWSPLPFPCLNQINV